MKILRHIKQRRTIRQFKPSKVPKKLLTVVLEAARFAPSAHNTQPWRFIILSNDYFKQMFLQDLKKYSTNLLSTVRFLLNNSIRILENAPHIIFVYNTQTFSKKVAHLGEPYTSLSKLSEIESIAAAIQNMHLTASTLGLGFAWLVFPILLKRRINRLLKSDDELVAVLAIGYPAEKPKKIFRKRIKQIVNFI